MPDPADTFFAAAREGTLLIQRCDRCGVHQFTLPGLSAGVERCRACTASHPRWVPAAGTGTIATYTVVHGRDRGPRTVAGLVELDEGPWVPARIEAEPERVRVGQPVVVAFAEGEDAARPVPVFVPG